jgi:hypothetical protein
MRGCAKHNNRQSRVETHSEFERGLALEAGLAPRISGQLMRGL